jgi:hypothetical protein
MFLNYRTLALDELIVLENFKNLTLTGQSGFPMKFGVEKEKTQT